MEIRKKILLVLPCLLIWSGTCGAGISTGSGGGSGSSGVDIQSPKKAVKGEVSETLNSAQTALNKASETTYEEMVPTMEEIQQNAKNCLNGIMNTDFSGDFGFDLDLPSINDMLSKSCGKIDSKIQNRIDSVSKELSPSFYNDLIETEMGMGMGNAYPPGNSINYDRKGQEIADDLWRKIERDKPWLKR